MGGVCRKPALPIPSFLHRLYRPAGEPNCKNQKDQKSARADQQGDCDLPLQGLLLGLGVAKSITHTSVRRGMSLQETQMLLRKLSKFPAVDLS